MPMDIMRGRSIPRILIYEQLLGAVKEAYHPLECTEIVAPGEVELMNGPPNLVIRKSLSNLLNYIQYKIQH